MPVEKPYCFQEWCSYSRVERIRTRRFATPNLSHHSGKLGKTNKRSFLHARKWKSSIYLMKSWGQIFISGQRLLQKNFVTPRDERKCWDEDVFLVQKLKVGQLIRHMRLTQLSSPSTRRALCVHTLVVTEMTGNYYTIFVLCTRDWCNHYNTLRVPCIQLCTMRVVLNPDAWSFPVVWLWPWTSWRLGFIPSNYLCVLFCSVTSHPAWFCCCIAGRRVDCGYIRRREAHGIGRY